MIDKRTFIFISFAYQCFMCLHSLFAVCCSSVLSNIATVARVVGELWVGAAVGRRVPDVQVHVRAERVEAGVLDAPTGHLRLAAEGRVRRRRYGRDGRHRGWSFMLEVALVGRALRRPDGSEQTGHGWEAAGTREVWLRRKDTRSVRSRQRLTDNKPFNVHKTTKVSASMILSRRPPSLPLAQLAVWVHWVFVVVLENTNSPHAAINIMTNNGRMCDFTTRPQCLTDVRLTSVILSFYCPRWRIINRVLRQTAASLRKKKPSEKVQFW